MSHFSTMHRGYFLALMFSLLTCQVALAASLVPDKSEIAIGETTYIKLDASFILTIDWSATPGISILDSGRSGATIKGTAAGPGSVTAKINGKKKSVQITVKPAQTAPEPRAGELLYQRDNASAPAQLAPMPGWPEPPAIHTQGVQSGTLALPPPNLPPADIQAILDELAQKAKKLADLAVDTADDKLGPGRHAGSVASHGGGGQALDEWAKYWKNLSQGLDNRGNTIPRDQWRAMFEGADKKAQWEKYKDWFGEQTGKLEKLGRAISIVDSGSKVAGAFYGGGARVAAVTLADEICKTGAVTFGGLFGAPWGPIGSVAGAAAGEELWGAFGHPEFERKAQFVKNLETWNATAGDRVKRTIGNLREFDGYMQGTVSEAEFRKAVHAYAEKYKQANEKKEKQRQKEVALLRQQAKAEPGLTPLIDIYESPATKLSPEQRVQLKEALQRAIQAKQAAGGKVDDDMRCALPPAPPSSGGRDYTSTPIQAPPVSDKQTDDYLSCLCRYCGGASGGYFTRDAKSECNGGCTCWGPLSGWCTAVPTPDAAVKSCYAGAFGVTEPNPEQIRQGQEIARDRNRQKLETTLQQQLGKNDLDGAIASASNAMQMDPGMESPMFREVAGRAKKSGWDALNQADHQTAVKRLEQAYSLDPNDADAQTKLQQARDYAAQWPRVEAKAKAFNGFIAERKIWSAQRAMLEMQDVLRGMAAGQSAENPLWQRVSNDFNQGLAEYNRFIQDKSARHTQFFKAQDYAAILRNAEEMRQRELSPADEREAQSRIDFANRFLAAGTLGGASSLAGGWNINANGYKGKLELSESGGRLSGRVWFDAHSVWEELRDIRFDGRTLRFLRPGPNQHYTGTLAGNEVRGTFDGGGSWNWVITRVSNSSSAQLPPVAEGGRSAASKRVLEDDKGPYQWVEGTEVQTQQVHAGRAAFRSTGNNHFTHRLGIAGDYADQYRYLDFWIYLIKPSADIQLQVQVDGAWGKRWGFDGDATYNGYGWAMEGATAGLPAGRWLQQRVDLLQQLHINAGQAITGLAFSSNGGDVYYDSVYLLPSASPTPPPRGDLNGKRVLEDEAGPYNWIEKTSVQNEVVAHGQAAFRSTGNNHFAGADLGVVGDYPEQFRSLSFWLFPIGPEADLQLQIQVDGAWGKRWGFDAGPKYNGYGSAMEGTTTGLKPGQWQEVSVDLLDQLHIKPGQKITGLAFSSDNGDAYYDSVYLHPNPNPARKPGFQPAGKLVLEDSADGYNWVERSEVENYLVFNGAKAFRSTGNNHFLADLGVAGSGRGQFRHLNFWAFFMGPEADVQVQVQVNGSWGKRWGYDAGPAYNGYGWAMEGASARMPNGRWVQIQLDLIGQLHLKPGDKITGLAFSSDHADVIYDSVYLLPDGVTPGVGGGFQGGESGPSGGRDYTYMPPPSQDSPPPVADGSGSLSLDKSRYAPGEAITVRFTAPAGWPDDAWIGIIPSSIPHGSEAVNDKHDVTYQYLKKRTAGSMTFNAPGPGAWDMRLHDSDSGGKEFASVSFQVGEPPPAPPGGRDYTGHVPQTAKSTVLFDNGNIAGVDNGPSQPTTFSLSTAHVITLIQNYHWNSARGATPGTIGLRDANGRLYGPWQSVGSPGQGGVPNAYWTVRPDIMLPAGVYSVIDSHPASWSRNGGSQQRGFTRVEGYPAGYNQIPDGGRDDSYAAPPNSSLSPPGKAEPSLEEQAGQALKALKGLFGK